MLTTKEATRIGRRGGQARARNLSPEKRSEIARWAWLNRKQKKLGEVTPAERRRQLIELLRAEDPTLAALLIFLSRLPLCRAEEIYEMVPDKQREVIERKVREVSFLNNSRRVGKKWPLTLSGR